MKQKHNIALISGGFSKESVVSEKSAKAVLKNIDKIKFNTYLISITQNGWFCLYNNEKIVIDKNDFSVETDNKKIFFDVAFIMIHGTPGEDGLLQSYFELLKIPYTTCDHALSSLSFHKHFFINIVKNYDIAVAKSLLINQKTKYDLSKISKEIGFPCFVKPNSGGSSIGTTKVIKQEQLEKALQTAFSEDKEVLIEQFIDGREITCGVFRYKDNVIVLPLTEIVSKKDFFDYEAKYTLGVADEITPAPLPDETAGKIKNISKKLYIQLGCIGVVRFDYILAKDNVYLLELNTVPGMTAISIVPQQANAYGLSFKELTTMVIEDALYRFDV